MDRQPQDRLGELRRRAERALRAAYEAGSGPSVVGHQLDVFLIEPGEDPLSRAALLFQPLSQGQAGLSCSRLRRHRVQQGHRGVHAARRSFWRRARHAMLYERGVGRLRSTLDLPGVSG